MKKIFPVIRISGICFNFELQKIDFFSYVYYPVDRRGAGHRFFYLYKLLTMKLLYTTIGLALF
ncbi:MAG: hypothetical protein KBF44_07685, partial [Chitinophagales bacterium]|nr:hypothetical protein [Chitinophagales bacterium]